MKFNVFFLLVILTAKSAYTSNVDMQNNLRVKKNCDPQRCTEDICKRNVTQWNQCFYDCWQHSENLITACINGAKSAGNINPAQQYIIAYFSGASVTFQGCQKNYINRKVLQ